MTVEWFLRRENNQWLGWKRITQNIRIFDERKNGGWSIWVRYELWVRFINHLMMESVHLSNSTKFQNG